MIYQVTDTAVEPAAEEDLPAAAENGTPPANEKSDEKLAAADEGAELTEQKEEKETPAVGQEEATPSDPAPGTDLAIDMLTISKHFSYQACDYVYVFPFGV